LGVGAGVPKGGWQEGGQGRGARGTRNIFILLRFRLLDARSCGSARPRVCTSAQRRKREDVNVQELLRFQVIVLMLLFFGCQREALAVANARAAQQAAGSSGRPIAGGRARKKSRNCPSQLVMRCRAAAAATSCWRLPVERARARRLGPQEEWLDLWASNRADAPTHKPQSCATSAREPGPLDRATSNEEETRNLQVPRAKGDGMDLRWLPPTSQRHIRDSEIRR